MSHARCYDALRHLYDPREEKVDGDDSEVMFVDVSTVRQLQFNPITDATAQVLCNLLQLKSEEQSMPSADIGDLGVPCKNVNIMADGNCFFRAISKAICGTEEHHATIRRATVRHLENNDATYQAFLRHGNLSVLEYVIQSKMCCLGTWATEVEIQAAADLLGLNIYTYAGRWIEYKCNGVRESNQGIYLEHYANHYETVVCVKKPNTQCCYGYCKLYDCGNSCTPQTPSTAPDLNSGLPNTTDCNDRNSARRDDQCSHRSSSSDIADPQRTAECNDCDDARQDDLFGHCSSLSDIGDCRRTADCNDCDNAWRDDSSSHYSNWSDTYEWQTTADYDDLDMSTDSHVYDDNAVIVTDGRGCSQRDHRGDLHDTMDCDQRPNNSHVHGDDQTIVTEEDGNPGSRNLDWLPLNGSWLSFLEWLGSRWWGSVSETQIVSHMNRPRGRTGDIIISAHYGDIVHRGATCSITVKTEQAVLTYPVVIRGGCYVCTDLVQGGFPTPIEMLQKLAGDMEYIHLLPRPKMVACTPETFPATNIVDEMCHMLNVLKGAWWGSIDNLSEGSSQYLLVTQSLTRIQLGNNKIPGAVIHSRAEDSAGYLFEVVLSSGKRLKVTFDRLGFTLGTRKQFEGTSDRLGGELGTESRHFREITSLLSHLGKDENVSYAYNRLSLQ